MTDFVAIDFETANRNLCSVCSVGIVIVQNGEIVDTFYSLIQPEPNYYSYFCQRVHGLSNTDTDSADIFPDVWHEIEKLVYNYFPSDADVIFVAHNARFDESCLKSVFKVYQMTYPDYIFLDTLKWSRRYFKKTLPNHQLQTVAAACGFDLVHHHNALSDAEACAAIALKMQ